MVKMLIQTKVVTQIIVSGARTDKQGFLPITLMLEDVEANAGRISITHDGQTWNGYWGSMGCNSIAQFFVNESASYLSGNLGAPPYGEYDLKGTRKYAVEVLKERKAQREIDHATRMRLQVAVSAGMHDPMAEHELMTEVFGPDWPQFCKQKPTDRYLHFMELIKVVQAALRQHLNLTPTVEKSA
jgi:hypothetical protein